ncbi:MAG: ATP-binding protein [Candidatus Brockarchaeota archaeon]|nr:ATP-binding protein [Candidatus Brockarchaeota archaeon]
MLFDLKPKEHREELFDREEEYEELKRLVDSGLWVAVVGKRMTGKTSLLKTFANENNGIYVNLLGARSIEGLVRKLAAESGFKLDEVSLDLRFIQVKWSRVLEDVFARIKNRVIALDEVQEVSSHYFLKVLKSVWDKYRGVKIVFSGSYVGILRRLLEPSPASPLYGRKPAKLLLKPFSRELSKKFLENGFRENPRVRVRSEEIEEAVDRLNGYVGWLTYYGNFRCVRRLSHEEALRETVNEGSKIILEELENFLKGRRRELYVKTLRTVSNGARWSEVKKTLNANSKVVKIVLETLCSAMIVEEKEGYYWIEDPIIKEAVRRMK